MKFQESASSIQPEPSTKQSAENVQRKSRRKRSSVLAYWDFEGGTSEIEKGINRVNIKNKENIGPEVSSKQTKVKNKKNDNSDKVKEKSGSKATSKLTKVKNNNNSDKGKEKGGSKVTSKRSKVGAVENDNLNKVEKEKLDKIPVENLQLQDQANDEDMFSVKIRDLKFMKYTLDSKSGDVYIADGLKTPRYTSKVVVVSSGSVDLVVPEDVAVVVFEGKGAVTAQAPNGITRDLPMSVGDSVNVPKGCKIMISKESSSVESFTILLITSVDKSHPYYVVPNEPQLPDNRAVG